MEYEKKAEGFFLKYILKSSCTYLTSGKSFLAVFIASLFISSPIVSPLTASFNIQVLTPNPHPISNKLFTGFESK